MHVLLEKITKAFRGDISSIFSVLVCWIVNLDLELFNFKWVWLVGIITLLIKKWR
jgi:hypothetical protein